MSELPGPAAAGSPHVAGGEPAPEPGPAPEGGYQQHAEGPEEPAEPALPPRTGHPAVDGALQAVTGVAGASPGEQVPAFQAAHRTLRETLESIDEG